MIVDQFVHTRCRCFRQTFRDFRPIHVAACLLNDPNQMLQGGIAFRDEFKRKNPAAATRDSALVDLRISTTRACGWSNGIRMTLRPKNEHAA